MRHPPRPARSRNWKAWAASAAPGGAGAQCGAGYDFASLAFKTDAGGLKGKAKVGFAVQAAGGKLPDFSLTLASSDKARAAPRGAAHCCAALRAARCVRACLCRAHEHLATPAPPRAARPRRQGACRTLGIASLSASRWEGEWAFFDVPLGAFAEQQDWGGGAFAGCGGAVGDWDANQVGVRGPRGLG